MEAVLGACAVLLPAPCCEMRLRQDQYCEAYACNFLGLTARGNVPEHVLGAPGCVLLQVSRGSLVPRSPADSRIGLGADHPATPQSPQARLLRHLSSRVVESNLALTVPRMEAGAPPARPQLVTAVLAFLERPNLSAAADLQWFAALREQWLTHARVRA